MIASDAGLSEGYGHDGPGVCLGDGRTEAEGVPLQSGRGDMSCTFPLVSDMALQNVSTVWNS